MLVVEMIGRIRREHLGKGKSIKEIARTLRLSRNTVRRIHEIKHDGYRLFVRKSAGRVVLWSRYGTDMTHYMKRIAAAGSTSRAPLRKPDSRPFWVGFASVRQKAANSSQRGCFNVRRSRVLALLWRSEAGNQQTLGVRPLPVAIALINRHDMSVCFAEYAPTPSYAMPCYTICLAAYSRYFHYTIPRCTVYLA
jgi:hypothetical protein